MVTYFFFHIPKTGGTSFKRVLTRWMKTRRDVDMSPADLSALANSQQESLCIHGHFGGQVLSRGGALLSRYPWIVGNRNAFVFTLLRDPVEQAISFYYHELAAGRTKQPLLDFLSAPHETAMSRVLELRSRDDIEPALESFGFVGIMEDLQQTTDRLAEILGQPSIDIPTENVGVRDTQILDVTPAQRQKIADLFPIDVELYARARDAFHGGKPIVWRSETQFHYLRRRHKAKIAASSAAGAQTGAARILSFVAHDRHGEPRGHFKCTEPVGLTVEFEIAEDGIVVEPAIQVSRLGHVVFVVAYVPEFEQASSFKKGVHKATCWIPANLLNPGPFEITSNLATPYPVAKLDQTIDAVILQVVEDDDGTESARGAWRTDFPGAVRPLLKWNAS